MKSIAIILLLFSTATRAQRHDPFDRRLIFEQFKKEDSLEGLYTNSDLLYVITDTLPLTTINETVNWKDVQLVSYFYDDSKTLKKIAFRNGRNGHYYFYFEGANLKKARVVKSSSIAVQYYYTAEENKITNSELERRSLQEPGKKQFYETLKLGRHFFKKFPAKTIASNPGKVGVDFSFTLMN